MSIRPMSADDLEVARQFLEALAAAARTGDRDAMYPLLAPEVEWVTPKRELHGIDEIHDQLTWVSPPDNLDVEFGEPEITDLGGGRIVSNVHEIYRMKDTGDFAYTRDRRIKLTIRDGKVARYEMRVG
jgi:ketosteroid isomerase-like protein